MRRKPPSHCQEGDPFILCGKKQEQALPEHDIGSRISLPRNLRRRRCPLQRSAFQVLLLAARPEPRAEELTASGAMLWAV